MFEVIVQLPSEKGGSSHYARLSVRDRTNWKTRRIAEKHAREYRMTHFLDAWVSEA